MAITQHTEIVGATKACTRCHRTLPATRDFFHRHPSGRLGLQAACRECQATSKRLYYKTAAGKAAANAYRAKNLERITAYNRSRPPMTEAKREEGRRRAAAWYEANKERARASFKKWRSSPENKAKNRAHQSRYHARRLRRDGEYALRRKTRSAILHALSQGRIKGRGRWWEAALGYTLEQLRRHIEGQFQPGMTWDNHGTLWEIDHIKPLAGFVIPDAQCLAFKEAWALTNLRPLLKAENRNKGGPRPP